MTGKVVARGAEAVLYLDEQMDSSGGVLVKERIRKGYRLPQIDEKIRKQRTRREVRMLSRAAGSGMNVPGVVFADHDKISMDFIEGSTVKESLNDMGEKERADVCEKIGDAIACLHRIGMVHGDLTTSNMILRSEGEGQGDRKGRKLYIIDFGLGKFSQKVEDQAVDMFLLYEALKAAHYKYLNMAWQNILKIYKQNYSNADMVLKRFESIATRRRYK